MSTALRKREMKACTTCAKAKVRCETEYRKDKCKRCFRLGKVCANQAPGAHSQKRWLNNSSNKEHLARLESKVDSVTQILSARSSHDTNGNRSDQPSLSPSPWPSTRDLNLLSTVQPNNHETLLFLNRFRRDMAPLFPFVVELTYLTAKQLQSEKPMLYTTIMMIACQSDLDRQLDLASFVREEISQTVFIRGEKNLSILQAILVYLAWNQMHLGLGSQFSNLLYLAIGMATELGFHKEAHAYSKTSPGLMGEVGRNRSKDASRTPEERRLFLGLFWLSSITKVCTKDMDAIRFSRYADACCRILEINREFPSDVYLVQLVRIQQMAEKVGDVLYNDDIGTSPSISPSLAANVSSLEDKYRQMESTLSLDIPQAPLLQIAYKTIGLYFYKVALDDEIFPVSLTTAINDPSAQYRILRTTLLTCCISAIQSLANQFLSLAPSIIFAIPYPVWGQMGHAMLILSRVMELNHEVWSMVHESELYVNDYRDIFRRFAERIEEVQAIGMNEVPMRKLPQIYDLLVGRLKQLSRAGGLSEVGVQATVSDAPFNDDMMNGAWYDFFDLEQSGVEESQH